MMAWSSVSCMLIDELLAKEHRFWRAAGDADFYREHFADDGLMVFHIGLMSKDDVVASMSGAEEWESYTIDSPTCVPITSDVAALVYTTVATTADGSEYTAAVTSVYSRRDAGWTLVLHQQTPRSFD